jgi:predicted DNA-binding transcriptional regulator AlpA
MPNSERLTVNIKTAAAMLGISKNLAYDLAKRGELPGCIKLGQKRIVVSRAQLERLLLGNHETKDSEVLPQ